MKCYRIKHIPTGLYFCPSREVKHKDDGWYCKSNLSKKGKIYTMKPSIKWIGPLVYSHLLPRPDPTGPTRTRHPTFAFVESEWKIEEI